MESHERVIREYIYQRGIIKKEKILDKLHLESKVISKI